MYRLCVFDLDGTLADTLDSLHKSVNLALEKSGFSPISRSRCMAFVGNGARVLVEKALSENQITDRDTVEKCFLDFKKYFARYYSYNVRIYPGVRELLEKMKGEGMRLGVFSNKLHEQAKEVVTELFGEELFDFIQGQSDDVPKKPDPTGLFKMMERAGVSVSDTVYVGDSEVDVKTAFNAGLPLVAVDWGFRSRQELIENGAEHIVSTAEELERELCNAEV